MRDLSSLQSVLAGLSTWGRRPAIGLRSTLATRWWSYRRLHRNALYAAHLFQQQRLTPGERILLFAPNSPEWAACLLGAAWRGLVVAAVDAATPPAEVQRLAIETNCTVIVVIGRHSTAGITHRTLRILDLEAPPGLTLDAAALRCQIKPSDTAVILFTSGTGGKPRAVPLTHHNLACQLPRFQFWRPVLRIAPTRLLALSPLSHIQGLLLSLCVPLTLGLSVLYSTSIEPQHLQRTLRFGRIRILSTVPRVLQLLQDSMEMHAGSSPSVLRRRLLGRTFRGILTGGATLPLARELFWRKAGVVLVQGYGSTESTGFVTINRPVVGRRGSIGRAVHRDSLHIAPDGELFVRGPHVAPGCAADGESADSTTGFFPTGDLVRQDCSGRLYFLGRKTERIVTAEGHNIDPNQIETALREHAALMDAVVFAGDNAGLEELHAVLLLDDPSAAVAAQIVQQTNRTLAPWQRIRGWTAWQQRDFPRAALGKPKREEIIEAVRNLGASASVPGVPLSQPAIERILEEPDSHSRIAGVAAYLRRTQPNATEPELRARARQFDLDSIEEAELFMLLGQTGPRPAVTDAPKPHTPEMPTAEATTTDLPRSSAPMVAPAWQHSIAGAVMRAIFGSLFRGVVLPVSLRVRVTGREKLAQLDAHAGPILFAVHRPDREHPVEYLALIRALPWRFARRVLLLMGDRPLLETHFYRKPQDSALYRIFVAGIVNLAIPSVLPLVIFGGGTITGLEETDFWIARGFHPLVTWTRATARLAAETQATVVPVRLAGKRTGWWTSRVEVQFEDPVRLSPFAGDVAAHIQIESATAAPIETDLRSTSSASRIEAPIQSDTLRSAHASTPASRPSIAGTLVRSILGPVFRRVVLPLGLRVQVTGVDNLAQLDDQGGAIFFAVHRHERKHPVEILALVRALPMRLARRAMIVMGVPNLEEKLQQDPAHATRYRLYASAMINIGIPAVFPVVIGGQGTIAGMEETDYWLARGFHPIVTWSRAMARLASETQATVVPVRLGGHRPGWFRSRAEIHFAEPIRLYPFSSDMAADIQVQTAFNAPTELVS